MFLSIIKVAFGPIKLINLSRISSHTVQLKTWVRQIVESGGFKINLFG
jgi:hypothetical protein